MNNKNTEIEIAEEMLNGAELSRGLKDHLTDISYLCNRAGGALVSRQVIAHAIVQ
jgi:hypothetical protein